MPGRVKASLEGNSTKVSKDLALAISTYGTRQRREFYDPSTRSF
mgnify:CR=1 FL=1